MALCITEFAENVRRSPSLGNVPSEPYLAVTNISSGGSTVTASTTTFSANTRLITLAASNGPCFFVIGSSTYVFPGSSVTQLLPANTIITRRVSPGGHIIAYST